MDLSIGNYVVKTKVAKSFCWKSTLLIDSLYRLFIHVDTKYFVCKHGSVKAPVSEKQDWSV